MHAMTEKLCTCCAIRIAILAFFKPKTTNLAFFESVWLANFLLDFWLFFGFFIIENLKFGFVQFSDEISLFD